MKKILAAVLMLAALPMSAFAVSGNVTLINTTALGYNSTPSQNLLNFGGSSTVSNGVASKLSAQVTFSSANIPSQSFTGGQVSTASITITSTAPLVAQYATDTLVVPSTAAILGVSATDYVTVQSTTGLLGTQATFTTQLGNFAGIQASSPTLYLSPYYSFTYGSNWASTDTITDALNTLVVAINATGVYTSTSVVVSTQVVVTYVAYGSFPNGYAVISSSLTDISSGTFSKGANPATLTINNGVQALAFTYGGNWVSSNSVTGAANTLASIINSVKGNGTNGIASQNIAGIVYSTATTVGTAANAWTVSSSTPALLTVGGPAFAGGANRALTNAYFTIGGTQYKNGFAWTDLSNTSSGTMASIVSFITQNTTNTIAAAGGTCANISTASWVGQTITFTSGLMASACNTLTFAQSGFTSVGSALFTGGQDNASFAIGSVMFSYPTNWNLGVSSTPTTTAASIAAAINANSITNVVIVATNVAGVVNATGTVNGVNTNYSLISSTIDLGCVGFVGGLNTAFSSGSAIINISSHNFTTGLPVVFSTGIVPITGLTNQTTYFVIVVDVNDIELAASTANALANVPIVLRSTDTTTTAHTFTLSPSAFVQGPAAAIWQVSNDGVNWANYMATSQGIAVSSNTFTPIIPSSTTVVDFGMIDYSNIRYNITGPTSGAIAIKVILSSKD